MRSLFSLFVLLISTVQIFAQSVGIGTTTPVGGLQVDTSVIFTGTINSGTTPISGPGVRLMWLPHKAAFRVGNVLGNKWDNDSIGNHSVAFNFDTKARGQSSSAFGLFTEALGENSSAFGTSTKAIGYNSNAFGFNTKAIGHSAFTANLYTEARAHSSSAFGWRSKANGFASFVVGMYNDTIVSPQTTSSPPSVTPTTPLFIVGNGEQNALSNAMIVRKDGRVGIGTNDPTQVLDIEGALRMRAGSPSTGKVLASLDDYGSAHWIDLPLYQNFWTQNQNFIHSDTNRVIIGASSISSSAILEVASDSLGVLIPRMTITQRDAIENPTEGLLIYQTGTLAGFYYYSNGEWTQVGKGGNDWIKEDEKLVTPIQQVGLGLGAVSGIDPSAAFQIENDVKGILIPRLSQLDREDISSPAQGLLVYQFNNDFGFYFYHNGWHKVGGGGNAWTENGSTELYTNKSVGIGNNDPNDYAILDITSTEKGILIPRMTEAQRDEILNPDGGLLIYQTGINNGLFHFDGGDDTWKKIGGDGNEWTKNGSTELYTNKSVGIGTINPNDKAILDLSSSDKGFLMPRMTTAQRDAISAPVQGLKIFNIDDRCEDTYDGQVWNKKCDMMKNGEATLPADGWRPRADIFGNGRAWAISFVINGKAYVCSGDENGSNYKRDMWEYDPDTDVWTQKADFGGTARFGAISFVINGKAYVGTGRDGSNYKRDMWEYDPATDVWTQKADFGGTARYGAISFVINGKAYVGTGGENAMNRKKDIWEYDPTTDVWTQKADFGGTARTGVIAFVINGKAYVGTGFDETTLKKDIWEYNPTTDVWTQKADFGGTARYGAISFVINSKAYIGTGYGNFYNNSLYRRDFWEYDPAIDVWTQKANFGGTARYGAISIVINDKAYVGTGWDGIFRKDIWEYNNIGISGKEYKENIPSDAVLYRGHDWTSAGNEIYTTLEEVKATIRGSLKVDGISELNANSNANGYNSTAMNYGDANGSISTAMNTGEANGVNSTAMNNGEANGGYSTAIGVSTVSNGYGSFVCGVYNDNIVSVQESSLDLTDETPLFIIGNGDNGNSSNAMVVRKNGNTTIGGNGGDAKLQVVNGDEASLTTNGYLMIGSENGSNLIFDKNEIQGRDNGSSANIYLQNEGSYVIIGEGVPENKLTVYGNAYKSSGGTSWVNSSDKRLKEDVSSFKDGLTEILKIDPIWYRYTKESGCDYSQKYVGVIAQELQKISPYMVSESNKIAKDGTPYLQVDNSAMTYMLINAVKEQQAMIEKLTQEKEDLKNKSVREITSLSSDMNTLKSEIENLKSLISNNLIVKK